MDRMNENTIELAGVFIDFYFDKFDAKEDLQKLNYIALVRDEVLKRFLNESTFRGVQGFELNRVINYYKI
jgi:hypothetical protein